MSRMLSYVDRSSPVHALCGATKFLFFLMWSILAMMTFDTRILLALVGLGLWLFRVSRTKFSEVSFILKLLLAFMALNLAAIYAFAPEQGVPDLRNPASALVGVRAVYTDLRTAAVRVQCIPEILCGGAGCHRADDHHPSHGIRLLASPYRHALLRGLRHLPHAAVYPGCAAGIHRHFTIPAGPRCRNVQKGLARQTPEGQRRDSDAAGVLLTGAVSTPSAMPWSFAASARKSNERGTPAGRSQNAIFWYSALASPASRSDCGSPLKMATGSGIHSSQDSPKRARNGNTAWTHG